LSINVLNLANCVSMPITDLNQFERSPRVKASFVKQRHGDNGETFGMTKVEMTEDFDFEGSNAQFEKRM